MSEETAKPQEEKDNQTPTETPETPETPPTNEGDKPAQGGDKPAQGDGDKDKKPAEEDKRTDSQKKAHEELQSWEKQFDKDKNGLSDAQKNTQEYKKAAQKAAQVAAGNKAASDFSATTTADNADDIYKSIIGLNFIDGDGGICSIIDNYPWTIDTFTKLQSDGSSFATSSPMPYCYLVEYQQKYSSNITNFVNTLVAAVSALNDEKTSNAVDNVSKKIGSLYNSLVSAVTGEASKSQTSGGKALATRVYEGLASGLSQLLGYMTNGVATDIISGGPISTSKILKPYSLLYALKGTGKKFVFPMLSQPPLNKVINEYGDKQGSDSVLSNNSFLNWINETTSGIVSFTRDFRDLSSLLGNTSEAQITLSQVEKAKFFQYPTATEEYTISFPLLNTVKNPTPNGQPYWKRNYKFILYFTLRNMIYRRDNASFYPPLFYDLIIPGVIRQPFCFVNGFSVKPLGMVRMMHIDNPLKSLTSSEKSAIAVAVPEAWIVTIKVKSLIATSANMVLSGFTDLSIQSSQQS